MSKDSIATLLGASQELWVVYIYTHEAFYLDRSKEYDRLDLDTPGDPQGNLEMYENPHISLRGNVGSPARYLISSSACPLWETIYKYGCDRGYDEKYTRIYQVYT